MSHPTICQEEAVEETASLVANMRQSMRTIDERIETLLQSSDKSSSAAIQMNQSIDEVAGSTATLHEVVEASASSVHEMGASIRQVAEGAEKAHTGAIMGADAVRATIKDIERISTLTHHAKDQLGGLLARVSQIGNVLARSHGPRRNNPGTQRTSRKPRKRLRSRFNRSPRPSASSAGPVNPCSKTRSARWTPVGTCIARPRSSA